MRTTIDMPDHLYRRVKREAVRRRTTLRWLIIDCVEQSLASNETPGFVLRDASAGYAPAESGDPPVSNEAINKAIDEGREGLYGQ